MKKEILDKIINIIRYNLVEEVPTNNASSGNIAGLPPDQPPVSKRKKFIFGGPKSRTPWIRNLKKK